MPNDYNDGDLRHYNKGRGHYIGRRFICNETGQVFDSIEEAARVLGCNKGAISKILRGEHRHKHHGYTFSWIDEEDV